MIGLFLFICQLLLAASSLADKWEIVKEVLETQEFVKDFGFTVGNEVRLFEYVGGNFTMEQKVPIASSTKMVSSTIILNLIEDNKLSLEDYVTDYLDFWTKDANDSRSRIKVKDCLTFTSGYTFGLSHEDVCTPMHSFAECLEIKYNKFKHNEEPGSTWDYNEFHLQILGGVAENITNIRMETLLKQHLMALNMTNSYYSPAKNPDLSGSLISTGRDYEQFIYKLWKKEAINANTFNITFQDYTPYPQVKLSNSTFFILWFLGHYGYTNFFECPLFILKGFPEFPQECIDNNVHSDMGVFGWWPLYDLKLNYWMQIAQGGEALIGPVTSFLLRVLIKPFVDRAIKNEPQPLISSIDWDYFKNLEKTLLSDRELINALEKMKPRPY